MQTEYSKGHPPAPTFGRFVTVKPFPSVLIYQLNTTNAVNDWLLAHLRMCFNVLLCHKYVYLWTRLFFYGCNSMHIATQLPVVTVSFIVAANITTLKPFNTVIGWRQPVWKWAKVEKPYENWWRATPYCDAFCCFPTALLINCVSQGILSPQNKPQSYFVATMSTERYWFDLILLGLIGASLRWLVLELAITVINPFKCPNAERLGMHIIYI